MTPSRKLVSYACYLLGLGYVAYLLQSAWPQLNLLLHGVQWGWIAVSTLAFLVHTFLVCKLLHELFLAAGVDIGLRGTGRMFYLSQMTKYVPCVVWWFAMQASLVQSENAVRKVVFANVRMMLFLAASFPLLSVALLSLLVPSLSPAWLLLLLPISVFSIYVLDGFQFVHRLPDTAKRYIPEALLQELQPTAYGAGRILLNCLMQFALYIATAATMVAAFYDMPVADLITLATYHCLGWIAGVISVVVPAGMGVREGVFLLLGGIANQYPAEQLQSLAVITRSLQIMQEVILSLGALLLVKLRWL